MTHSALFQNDFLLTDVDARVKPGHDGGNEMM
jgi:hypothetical protein